MKLIGIDPGSKGCIVELCVQDKICRWMKLPYREDNVLDSRLIESKFDFCLAHYIYVEKLTPNPVFGLSNFTFGEMFASCKDLVKYYPYELVSPATWQRMLKYSKTDKRPAKEKTKEVFRKMNPNFGKITKAEHEGMIDAFFIAYYGGFSNHVIMPKDFLFIEVV